MKKYAFYVIIVFAIIIAVSCNSPVGDEFTETILSGIKEGKTYTLIISHPVARAAVGDGFTLKVAKNGIEKISSGKIESVDGTNLVYQPKQKGAPNFTVGFSGTKLTFITGTITFDDDTSELGPGSFTTSGAVGGGGSGGGGGGGGSSVPTVTSVTITQPASIKRGEEQLFTAKVNGTNNPLQTVTWTVTGNRAPGTCISEGGLLTVDAFEPATTLTVTAVSTFDTTKSGSATVTVNDLINVITPALEISSSVSVPKDSALVLGINIANLTAINEQHKTNGGNIQCQWYSNSKDSTQGGTYVGEGYSLNLKNAAIGTFYYYVKVTNTINDGSGTRTIEVLIGPVTVTVTEKLTSIIVTKMPGKVYKMCEEIKKDDLEVVNVYGNGHTELTTDYSIIENYDSTKGYTYTFQAGSSIITIVSDIDATKTASFNVIVSNEFIGTGLPVIYIDTQNAAPIVSREDWVNTKIKVVSDNPEWAFYKTDFRDQIRGRGHGSWTDNPKKPYRIQFSENTSMFGLTASRNWVLLADYIVPTFLSNTVAFELEQRFDGPLFKNHFVYVDVVLNGQYNGVYILTEHMRVGKGRVEIDEYNDYFVELDWYYDEDPKFQTMNFYLPVMIKSPDFGNDSKNQRYEFIIDSLNEYDTLLYDDNFPNNDWQKKIDIDSLVDWMLINEILANHEIRVNGMKNVYLYKVAGDENKIKMSHVWDFDWSLIANGLDYPIGRMKGGWFFERFHKDAEFTRKYRDRWNEKYSILQSMPTFFDSIAKKIRESALLDNKRWHEGVYNFDEQMSKLSVFWNKRVDYLNSAINN